MNYYDKSGIQKWFEQNLGEIESPYDYDIKSPLSNAPKPFNFRSRIHSISILLLLSFITSIIMAFADSILDHWFFSWFSNACLNLSIGLIASIILMFFTEDKSRNITFYTDILPILKSRYTKMHNAYFQFTFKIDQYYQQKAWDKYYDAWHVHCNTCFVIAGFFQYLLQVLPFTPRAITFDKEKLSGLINSWSDINQQLQNDYFHNHQITENDYKNCKILSDQGFALLNTLKCVIDDLEQDLFATKYNKKWLTESEQKDIERRGKQ